MPDEATFIKIIKENELTILKIVQVYGKDQEDKKDLYQEIVYQIWKSFALFRGKAKISTWIYRIALNTCLNHRNKASRRKDTIESFPEWKVWHKDDDSDKQEKIQYMYSLIHQLNEIEKAITLLYLEEKSYEEIAEITGLSATNVGTRLNRIKQKLKTQAKTQEIWN